MPNCAVSSCKNDSNLKNKYKGGITYHHFPKDPDTRSKWIDATGRYDWYPTKYSCICSAHFTEADFLHSGRASGRRHLLKDAIPAINLHPLLFSDALSVGTYPGSSQDYDNAEDPLNFSRRKRKLPIKMVRPENVKRQCLQIKRLQVKKIVYKKKITNIEEVINKIRKRSLMQEEQLTVLKCSSVKARDLNSRHALNIKMGVTLKTKCTPALKSFALTLHYYSPRAYKYIRQTFDTCLPHPRIFTKWYQSVEGKAGFTKESFAAIKNKVSASEYPIICTLTLGEMAIRNKLEWDGNRFHGYVDIGAQIEGDYLPEAKEALVFLVTTVNGDWKVPVGYFLVDSISGEQRAGLVNCCLRLLHETGIEIVALTFDGCPTNIAMANSLGCHFNLDKLKPYFDHPVSKKPVNIFPDPCHMVKLVRNCFRAYNTFVDDEGRNISWIFLEELDDLQEKEQLYLINKVRRVHINFRQPKLKVKFATELFSHSVADALDFCNSNIGLNNFNNSEGTVQFLRTINNVFDILTSRTKHDFGYKKPINPANKDTIISFINDTEKYIKSLRLLDGSKVIDSRRKLGFIGLIVCMSTLKNVYVKTVEEEKKMAYIPSYKMGQDHLQHIFHNMRCHGNSINNLTAKEFQSIYKKFLVHVDSQNFVEGNCSSLQHVGVLNSSSSIDKINVTSERARFHEFPEDIDDFDKDKLSIYLYDDLFSSYTTQILTYIGGYVVHSLIKKIHCDTCAGALLSEEKNINHYLINFKNHRSVIFPSEDVINLCRKVEAILKENILNNNRLIVKRQVRKEIIITKLLHSLVGENIFFDCIYFHQFAQPPTENHLINLVKAVAGKYIDVRLHYYIKN